MKICTNPRRLVQWPVLLLLLLQVSFLSNAQKKKDAKSLEVSSTDAVYRPQNFGQYMKRWWLLDPVTIPGDSAMETQRKFFNEDQVSAGEVHPDQSAASF